MSSLTVNMVSTQPFAKFDRSCEIRAGKGYVSPVDIASTGALSGDTEETFEYLEVAYRDHEPALILVQTEPEFDFLHSDPRYRALVKKVGLTPSD